jgi:hypothetical protein
MAGFRDARGHRKDKGDFTEHIGHVVSYNAGPQGRERMHWLPQRLTVRLGGPEMPAKVCASCEGDGFLTPVPAQCFDLTDGKLAVCAVYSPLLKPCVACLGLGLVPL